MKRFEGQVAVITGGASGLGKAIARQIAAEGGAIELLDINQDLLLQVVHEFRALGFEVSGQTVDVTNEQAVKKSLAAIHQARGAIDILVNAAGIVGPTGMPVTEYPVDAFDQLYAVNLRGSFLITKYTLPFMQQKNYGRILLIASMAGKEGNPFMAGYSASKAGVIGLVKGVGKEFAETGITINGLAPAVIRTAMNEQTDPGQLAFLTAKIPMKRLGTVEEVASLATWIISREASFNTGFVFDLSGGRATY